MFNSCWITVSVMILLFKISKIEAQNKSDVLVLKSVNYPIVPINSTVSSYGNSTVGLTTTSINSQTNKNRPLQQNPDAEQIFLPLSPNNYHPEKVLERIRVVQSPQSPAHPSSIPHNIGNQHNRIHQHNQHNNNHNHQPSDQSLLDFSTYIVRPLHFDYAKELAEARANVKPLIFRPDSLHNILINNGYVVQPSLSDDNDQNDSGEDDVGNLGVEFRPTIMQIMAPTINRDLNQYHQNSGVQYERLHNSSSDGYNPLSVNYNPYGSSYQAYQPHSNQPRADPLIRNPYQTQQFSRPNMKLAAIGFSFFDELRKQNENPTNSYFSPYSTPTTQYIEANSNKQYSTFPPLQSQPQIQPQHLSPQLNLPQNQQYQQQPPQPQPQPHQQQQPYASPLVAVEPIRKPLYYKRNITKPIIKPIPSTLSTFTTTIRTKPKTTNRTKPTIKTTTTTEKDEDYETTTKQTLEPPYYHHDRYTSAYDNPFFGDSSKKYYSKFSNFNDDDNDDDDDDSSDDDSSDDYSSEESNGKYRNNRDRDNDNNNSGEEYDSFYESTQHSKNTKKPIFEKKTATTKKPNIKSNKPIWIKSTTNGFTSELNNNNNKPRFSKLIATTHRPPTTKSTFIETTSTADILEEDLEYIGNSNPDNKDEQYSYQEIKTFTDSLKPGLKINKYSRIKVIRHDKPSLPPPTTTSTSSSSSTSTSTTTQRPIFGTKRNSQKSKEHQKKNNNGVTNNSRSNTSLINKNSKYQTKSKTGKLIKKPTTPQSRGNVKFLYDDLIYHPEESRMISTIYTENGVVVNEDYGRVVNNDRLPGEDNAYNNNQLRSQMQGYRFPYDHQKELHLISSTTSTPIQPQPAASYPQIRYSSGPLLLGRISSEVERITPSSAAKKSTPKSSQPRQEERRYFQYVNVFDNGVGYNAGVGKGHDNHYVESHELANNTIGKFLKRVRWGDKDGGFGEHYYDLNHHKSTN